MIVSIAIFMVVAVVAVGSLVRIVALNRQAQALQSSVNNISFALDSMSREIRQGSKISCQANYQGGVIIPNAAPSSDCENIIPTPGSPTLVFFLTPKTAIDGGGNPCNLYYAYWFNSTGSTPPRYKLLKAQQTACGQMFNTGSFYSIVDDANVKITGYNLALFSTAGNSAFAYKWMFVRMTGYAGVKDTEQNYFDVQTSISQRVSD